MDIISHEAILQGTVYMKVTGKLIFLVFSTILIQLLANLNISLLLNRDLFSLVLMGMSIY